MFGRMDVTVREVFVGKPSVLGTQRGTPVYSAITKAKVAAAGLALSEVNLDGDEQADLSVHGGPEKAVYVYPVEHYPAWTADSFALNIGDAGENISLSGATEDDVRIGDVWSWGDTLVQVSQPRSPCYKLAMKTGRKDIIPALIDSGRTGWYLRVLKTGRVPTSGGMTLVKRKVERPTVAEVAILAFANVAQFDAGQRDAYLRLAENVLLRTPELAEQYRSGVVSKVARVEGIGAR
jgi:MOSC domain-containing protein YiiM